MKDITYAITTIGLLLLGYMLLSVFWGKEISAWFSMPLTSMKVSDLFALLVICVALFNLSTTHRK